MFSLSKAYLIIGFILISNSLVFGQDQKLADSLINIYQKGTFENELEILKQIAEYESDPGIALSYSEILIKKALDRSNYQFAHSGFLQKGNHLQSLGN